MSNHESENPRTSGRGVGQMQKKCWICGDVSDRDATEYELQFMIAVYFFKERQNGRWTGRYICSRCNSRIKAKERRGESVVAMPEQIQKCRQIHSISLRIVLGMPACIRKGGEVVHHGIGCGGCELISP